MNDELLTKLTRPGVGLESSTRGEPSEPDNLGCFGVLRGVRDRAVMLELYKKDGQVLAIGYSWIEAVHFDPQNGITLFVPGRRVAIQGLRLNQVGKGRVRLFEGIARHRVPWIREADRATLIATASEDVVVEQILWDS